MIQGLAFSEQVSQAIEADDQQAFLLGLISTAALWMHLGGSDIHFRPKISQAALVTQYSPEQRALLAAACDLYDLLMLCPQGRKALLDFLDKPILQEPKGE